MIVTRHSIERCPVVPCRPWATVAVLCALWLTIGVAMAEEQQTQAPAPRLLCQIAVGDAAERSAEGAVVIGNLETIRLTAELVSTGTEVPPVHLAGAAEDEGGRLEIEAVRLEGEERSPVAVSAVEVGTRAEGGRTQLDLLLEIPPSEEEQDAAFERFLAKMREESHKEGRLAEFERLTADKEALRAGLASLLRSHRTGRFEIQCTYSAGSEEPWQGVVKSPPVVLEIRHEGDPIDRLNLTDGAPPAGG